MLRLCGAELVEVPAVPYTNPNNYVKVSGRLAEQFAKTETNGAIWANQFDNVANRQGAYRDDRPGDLAADRRQGRRLHLRGRHRRHARGRRNGTQGAQQERAHRPRRSDGRRAVQLLHRRRAQGRRLLDHRRHRPGPHHQEPRRRPDRRRLSDSRRGGGAGHLRPARARRACASAARPASTSPARSGWPRRWGRATPSSPCSADCGTRYQSKLFNPDFLRAKGLPVPEWLERRNNVNVPFERILNSGLIACHDPPRRPIACFAKIHI